MLNNMNSLWYLLFFFLCAAAPPVPPACLIQQEINRGFQKTSCSDGNRKILADLVNPTPEEDFGQAERFGAANIADLIMARSAVIYDHQRHNLNNLHICLKHLNEIGKDWRKSQRTRVHGNLIHACKIPTLEGFPSEHSPTTVGSRTLTKDESLIIWQYFHLFVPLGTGMCFRHQNFIRSLPNGGQQSVDAETNTEQLQPLAEQDQGIPKTCDIGKHIKRVERQCLRDYSINTYIRQIEQNQLYSSAPGGILDALRSQQTEESAVDAEYPLGVGWALKDRKNTRRPRFRVPGNSKWIQVYSAWNGYIPRGNTAFHEAHVVPCQYTWNTHGFHVTHVVYMM